MASTASEYGVLSNTRVGNKYSICIDKLELLLEGNLSKVFNSEISFHKIKPIYGFAQSFEVEVKGVKLARISIEPNSKLRYALRDITLVQVLNEQLYAKDTHELLKLTMADLPIYSYKAMDIAIDGPKLMDDYLRLEKKFSGGRLGRIEKRTEFDDRNDVTSGVTLGSRRSDKYVTIYDKAQEINTNHKPYVKEYWELNGLSGADIHRVELRLGPRELKRTNLEFDGIFRAEYLWSLFHSKTNKILSFKDPDSNGIHSLFNNSTVGKFNFKKLTIVNHLQVLQSDKTAVKMLFCEYVRTNNIIFRNAAQEYVKARGLNDWYQNKQGIWLKPS